MKSPAAGVVTLTVLIATVPTWQVAPRSVSSTQSTSITAGETAFRRIVADGVREWEGDIEGRATWALDTYGDFLRQFPQHPRAGEALFAIAEATWARGGYPELFHYVMTPGTWADWKAKAQYLEQWFDTRGFGGGLAAPPKPPNSKEAARAREIFGEVLTKYPDSRAVPMSMYYRAVISDYCLNDARAALVDYEAFVQKYPSLVTYSQKARARIKALK